MAKKISKKDAYDMAKKMGIKFSADPHELSRDQRENLRHIAKLAGYRKPRNSASQLGVGSYFFEHLKKMKAKNGWK
jgi:hypothetical protein